MPPFSTTQKKHTFAPGIFDMNRLRQNIYIRYFWCLMAVHILNCSVDAPDAQPDYVPEDLFYNDVESIVEWVLEDVLNIENAIPEHDEPDNEDGFSLEMKKIVWFSPIFEGRLKLAPALITDESSKNNNLYYLAHLRSQYHREVITPPPQA
jgi:hypothetical protein